MSETVKASQVRVGDVIAAPGDQELTVTRIDVDGANGLPPGFIGFVEDSDVKWLKVPSPADGDVTVVRRG